MTIKKIISSYQPKKRKNQHKSAVARKWAAALLFSTYFFYFQTIPTKEYKKIQEDIFSVTRIVLFCFNRAEMFCIKGTFSTLQSEISIKNFRLEEFIMNGNHPKRRRDKYNPYHIYELEGHYYISFQTGKVFCKNLKLLKRCMRRLMNLN